MTVTAPLTPTDDLIISDNLPVVIPDPPADDMIDDYSILRDPIVPFLIVGVATFVALIVTAFLLSSPLA